MRRNSGRWPEFLYLEDPRDEMTLAEFPRLRGVWGEAPGYLQTRFMMTLASLSGSWWVETLLLTTSARM